MGSPMANPQDCAACADALAELAALGRILAVKVYRVAWQPPTGTPVIPCLDHEAMLHEQALPHVAAYLEDRDGQLHEVIVIPAQRRVQVDAVSTWGECTPASRQALIGALASRLPTYRVSVRGPKLWLGDQRVAEASRAHVSLRDVLSGSDLAGTRAAVDRLQTVGSLMEKQSRVASWSVRTLTGPMLALVGFLAVRLLGLAEPTLGPAAVSGLRYALIGVLGAVFLYYGLKAVQLTGMSTRVWKRAAEYKLILTERQRLAQGPTAVPAPARELA
jgi:hypothetical protein